MGPMAVSALRSRGAYKRARLFQLSEKIGVRSLYRCAYNALTVESGDPGSHSYLVDFIGGERGTRTLDLGIMSATL